MGLGEAVDTFRSIIVHLVVTVSSTVNENRLHQMAVLDLQYMRQVAYCTGFVRHYERPIVLARNKRQFHKLQILSITLSTGKVGSPLCLLAMMKLK